MKDPAYEEDVEEVFVRCLLCGDTMTVDEFEGWHELECDMAGYERL